MRLSSPLQVVKVQRALPLRVGRAMIHDQGCNHVEHRPLTAAEKHMMGQEVRTFFLAVWNADSTRWTLLERAQDRNW